MSKRRRTYQLGYNKKHNITPKSIKKPIRERIIEHEKGERGPWVFGDKEAVYASLPHL